MQVLIVAPFARLQTWHNRYGPSMSTQRMHVVFPNELLKEIDELVGPRGRTAFLVETAQAEVRRRRLSEWLRNDEPAWKDEDHPELKGGSAAWVRKLRAEKSSRTKAIEAKLRQR